MERTRNREVEQTSSSVVPSENVVVTVVIFTRLPSLFVVRFCVLALTLCLSVFSTLLLVVVSVEVF